MARRASHILAQTAEKDVFMGARLRWNQPKHTAYVKDTKLYNLKAFLFLHLILLQKFSEMCVGPNPSLTLTFGNYSFNVTAAPAAKFQGLVLTVNMRW